MQIEGIHIRNYKQLGDTLMMKSNILEDVILRSIERGKELALAEHEEKTTILTGKELAEFFRVEYRTIKNWRKKGHPKYEAKFIKNTTRIGMTLADAKQLRNQILGL